MVGRLTRRPETPPCKASRLGDLAQREQGTERREEIGRMAHRLGRYCRERMLERDGADGALVRLSIGLEDARDLMADLERGFAAI